MFISIIYIYISDIYIIWFSKYCSQHNIKQKWTVVSFRYIARFLTYWGRMTHICVGKLTIIGSDNGLSPERRQAIIRTNAVILLIRPLGTNFSEILIEIQTFSFKKMHLKISSAKGRPFCLGLNVLIHWFLMMPKWHPPGTVSSLVQAKDCSLGGTKPYLDQSWI